MGGVEGVKGRQDQPLNVTLDDRKDQWGPFPGGTLIFRAAFVVSKRVYGCVSPNSPKESYKTRESVSIRTKNIILMSLLDFEDKS